MIELPIEEIKNYKNMPHKIFCGAEAYLFTNSMAYKKGVELLQQKGNIYTNKKNKENVTQSMLTGKVLAKYYGFYLSSVSLTVQAFALELYFKCLIHIETNDFPHIHELDKLFEKISSENRNKIKIIYEDLIKRENGVREIKRMMGEEFNFDFDFLLKKSKNAFVDLRYLFEFNPDSYQFALTNHIFATRKLLMEFNPDWPSLIPVFP